MPSGGIGRVVGGIKLRGGAVDCVRAGMWLASIIASAKAAVASRRLIKPLPRRTM